MCCVPYLSKCLNIGACSLIALPGDFDCNLGVIHQYSGKAGAHATGAQRLMYITAWKMLHDGPAEDIIVHGIRQHAL